MAFEEWMNDSGWEPSEAGEAALEDAWQAAHAEGVAEGRAAERKRWLLLSEKLVILMQRAGGWCPVCNGKWNHAPDCPWIEAIKVEFTDGPR